jgi:tRNA(Ile)-lysidine synthase
MLVALSGGCDSVALAYVLHKLGYDVEAAHCNFQLRGEESDRDELFVRDLCQQWGVPLHIKSFQTEEYASQRRISIEMAARELRYAWFEKLREEGHFAGIAVAHHKDDNSETLLLNLCRGTGLRGLTGMKYRNGNICRPMLDISRLEIEQYLRSEGLSFITDSTNIDTKYKRNLIRHEILPRLGEINTSISQTLHQTTSRLNEALYFYELGLTQAKGDICTYTTDGVSLDIAKLVVHPAARTIIHEVLSEFQFKSSEAEMIFENLPSPSDLPTCKQGATFQNASYIATLHQGQLIVSPIPIFQPLTLLPEMGDITLPTGTLRIERLSRNELAEIPRHHLVCSLDTDCIKGPLSVRTITEGDRFHPFGMKGTKLVSDYLTDRHRSIIEKRNTIVVVDEEKILWLVGERPDARATITANTKRVTKLTFSQKE